MKTTVIGAFPKVSDEMGGQELRRALHSFDREEISADVLGRVYDETTAAAIDQMEQAGIDVVNDGQIRWDDLLAPFANAWGGVTRGPLERFYDTNTYFRRPVVTGPIRTDGQTLVSDFKLARRFAKRAQVKAAICGPLTFATLADNQHYQYFGDLITMVADAIVKEMAGLAYAGVKMIDIEEPAIVATKDPEHIREAMGLYRIIGDYAYRLRLEVTLQTYFFSADYVLAELGKLPRERFAGIGIDVRSRETSALERLGEITWDGKRVVLGAVDARNTKVESANEVADLIGKALLTVPSERLWVAPTTSLEYLPHDIAVKKLHALHSGMRLAEVSLP